MANHTKLNSHITKRIVELIKLRMPWSKIALAMGVTDRTIQNWRNQGKADRKSYEKGRRSPYHLLVDAIDEAKTELFEEYAAVVRNEALNGKVIIIEEERTLKDGSTITSVTKKIEPPNSTLAHKILQQEDPANWAEIKHIAIDWQKRVTAQGGDPDQLKEKIGEFIGGVHDVTEDDPDT